jgi:hypothetical protein
LPVDLLTELEAIAAAEGIGVEELVSRLLVDVLPGMVAQRTARWLGTTLSLAYPIDIDADVPGIREGRPDTRDMRHAIASHRNEQSPVAGDHEALSDEDFSTPDVEPHHSARPELKVDRRGSAT